ncbi:hypothetical protein SAMN05421813_11379 [Daejeonella rubra]|uniref:Uncharacterized protein n=1 Tax=Daejeonella rubra TaxID=990371 RepID=A0A1G9TM83_9SPHI|nr:hypothetical protein SAMN05421813_11379 [Daejeonella rubra]
MKMKSFEVFSLTLNELAINEFLQPGGADWRELISIQANLRWS